MGDSDAETDTRPEASTQVAALLTAAGLDLPDEEIDRLAALYPGLRRSVDRFHDIDAGDQVTAAVFRAGDQP